MEEYTTFAPNHQGHEGGNGSTGATECSLIWIHENCIPKPKPARTVQRQSAPQRREVVEKAHEALYALYGADAVAGHSAREEIDTSRRLYAAAGQDKDRKRVTLQLLGQRNGIARVMKVMERNDNIREGTPFVMAGLGILMAVSANVAALTGSGWDSTLVWLQRVHPFLGHLFEAEAEAMFLASLTAASSSLARRIPTRLSDYRTAPSVSEIAETLQITRSILRIAQANTVGLTSIDRETKRERDRRIAREKRRGNGSVEQANRTKTADTIALAKELGCNEKTLRRHEKNGTLEAFIAKRRGNVQNASPP